MDLRDLRYFEVIATLEHIGRASQQLHRTQPALTGCVRRLEKEAGAPLFEKAGRGIRLTAAGKVMLKWAQRMRFDVEDARREIASIGKASALKIADLHLAERPSIIGKRPTIADLSMAGYLFYGEELAVPLDPHVNVMKWLDRIQALPGWKHPYELMPRVWAG